MTYEEFKKELYRNILQSEEAQGKQIRLFERKSICSDMQDMNIIKALNLSCYGSVDIIIHEDIICAFWGVSQKLHLLHWRVRPLYNLYKEEGWQSVLPEIVMRLYQAGSNDKLLFAECGSYEQCSDRLILRPLNYHNNRQSLHNCIYWRYGDMALVLYGMLSDVGGEYLTTKIYRNATARWGVSDEGLLSNALLNCFLKMPPRLYKAEDIVANPKDVPGVFMRGEQGARVHIHPGNKWEAVRGYRLTTERQFNGALAIFYPGVRERLAKLMGGDYYVGFTSIHEAVIHPVQFKNLGDMKASIQHINAVFDEQEMLTNRVYRYYSKRRDLIEV